MKINISVFRSLDAIARSHNISDTDWAKHSDLRRPTIPELRRLSLNPNANIGRACTIGKIFALMNGLQKIIGGNDLRKNLRECAAGETDINVRLMLWAMILGDAPDDTKEAVEASMKIAASTIKTKKGE